LRRYSLDDRSASCLQRKLDNFGHVSLHHLSIIPQWREFVHLKRRP
jgi:hypothetical protein